MTCPKCQGLLLPDAYKKWRGWTCGNCGLVLDRTILFNKCQQQTTAEVSAARAAAEAIFTK